ncbi:hypothetical protein Q5P01_003514 [Channa striata]|uniref:Uncharacterized protein n=1 Tax=Channa striata TaxID=64152 RepID=A0AA88NH67_CHASR|nr:hypothetical protein Q5P01_003514 [Channa striata]
MFSLKLLNVITSNTPNLKCGEPTNNKSTEEMTQHNELESQKNIVKKEQMLRADGKLKTTKQKQNLCKEIGKLRKIFFRYDGNSPSELQINVAIRTIPHVWLPKAPIVRTYNPTMQPSAEGAKRIQALERENVELKLLLTQQKNLTAQLQTEVFSRQQALLHLQDELKELQQKYKQIRGLQKSGDTTTDGLVETACKTTGRLSGQDQEDKLRAWKTVRNLTLAHLNESPKGHRTDGVTNHVEHAGVQTPNSSENEVENAVRKVKRVRFAENVMEEEKDQDDVRVECAQVSSGCSELPDAPVKKRNTPSWWSRFINSFPCGSRSIKPVFEGE